MRLPRSPLLIAFSLLTSAATAPAQDAWTLWRRFIPTDNPEANDARLWRLSARANTENGCGRGGGEKPGARSRPKLRDDPGRGGQGEGHRPPASRDGRA